MSTLYESYILKIVLPILCVVAVVNNLAIIAVALFSTRFRKATFLSVRLLCITLALFEILQAMTSRGPAVLGIILLYIE